ncbi:GMC family oxidoreductase [Vannielia litorea]|uniref:GMC family oxidoreductase n=1 Tax=Vannielia litorea TaxID=1217970 RepID=UPI001C949B1D|nr:GMC family oxidoreductase N-terminal domain-containing protein [Vannielia litorea]MBY6046559.1 GMC family oxidoreductase N-terminal domain-containing protein [Vannielia litorea]MBY6073972.1 GMC family oxidoreductase N-terminal domain-containing protein [Vannielia litorea]
MKPIFTQALARGDRLMALQSGLVHGRLGRRRFIQLALAAGASLASAEAWAQDLGDAAITQRYNAQNIAGRYDYIVVGSGSGGAVVAGRLAAETDASVLVLEAGGTDQIDAVLNPLMWPTNIRSERDWGYSAEPSEHVNGRSLILPMGKVVGGGSSINVMIWARGHKNDFDFWASETGDDAWSYENVLEIYKRIEDWQGAPDDTRRGTGGRLWVTDVRDVNPIAPAFVEACGTAGIPGYADMNGEMMEGEGGAALANVRIKDGMRRNIPSDYLWETLKRPNITLLTGATVQKLTLNGTTVTGLTFEKDGESFEVEAGHTVLSAGAINTPKILMQSGIGPADHLAEHGIAVAHDLPGVGQNFQDHILAAGCVWEYTTPLPPGNSAAEATFFWKSGSSLDTPDLQPFQIEVPYASEVHGSAYAPPAGSWTIAPGIVRPQSTGEVRLTGPNPSDPVQIDGGFLKEPADLKALTTCIELCREIGNSGPLAEFVKREVMPGPITGAELDDFARNAAGTYFHESCTCKMGTDEMSVVSGSLAVHGVEGLSIADASAMPRVSTGNTMASTVVIGERMADILIG